MRYKVLFLLLIVCFIALSSICVYQQQVYPHPQYQTIVTEDDSFGYLDRGGGPMVERITLSTPDNPTWVNIMRSGWFRIFLIILFILILYLITKGYHRKVIDSRFDKWPQPPVAQ